MRFLSHIIVVLLATLSLTAAAQSSCPARALPYHENFDRHFTDDSPANWWITGSNYQQCPGGTTVNNCWTLWREGTFKCPSIDSLWDGDDECKSLGLSFVLPICGDSTRGATTQHGLGAVIVSPPLQQQPRALIFNSLNLTSRDGIPTHFTVEVGYVTDMSDCYNSFVAVDSVVFHSRINSWIALERQALTLNGIPQPYHVAWRTLYQPDQIFNCWGLYIDDVSILPSPHYEEITATICEGGYYTDNGFLVAANDLGPGQHILTHCDDTPDSTGEVLCHVLCLTILPRPVTDIDTAIMPGDALLWGDSAYVLPGTYTYDRHASEDACDSLERIHLHMKPLPPVQCRVAIEGERTVYANTTVNVQAYVADSNIRLHWEPARLFANPEDDTVYFPLNRNERRCITVTATIEDPINVIYQADTIDTIDNPLWLRAPIEPGVGYNLNVTIGDGSPRHVMVFFNGTFVLDDTVGTAPLTVDIVDDNDSTALIGILLPDADRFSNITLKRICTATDTACFTSWDTTSRGMEVEDIQGWWMPNAFSPGAESNRTIGVVGNVTFKDFRLNIYNREGLQVWQSDDPSRQWDGGTCQQGAYVWHLRYSLADTPQRSHSATGTIVLIR